MTSWWRPSFFSALPWIHKTYVFAHCWEDSLNIIYVYIYIIYIYIYIISIYIYFHLLSSIYAHQFNLAIPIFLKVHAPIYPHDCRWIPPLFTADWFISLFFEPYPERSPLPVITPLVDVTVSNPLYPLVIVNNFQYSLHIRIDFSRGISLHFFEISHS